MPWVNTTVSVVNRNESLAHVNTSWETSAGEVVFHYTELMIPTAPHMPGYKNRANAARDKFLNTKAQEETRAGEIETYMNEV